MTLSISWFAYKGFNFNFFDSFLFPSITSQHFLWISLLFRLHFSHANYSQRQKNMIHIDCLLKIPMKKNSISTNCHHRIKRQTNQPHSRFRVKKNLVWEKNDDHRRRNTTIKEQRALSAWARMGEKWRGQRRRSRKKQKQSEAVRRVPVTQSQTQNNIRYFHCVTAPTSHPNCTNILRISLLFTFAFSNSLLRSLSLTHSLFFFSCVLLRSTILAPMNFILFYKHVT